MNKILRVTVRERKLNGSSTYEGVAQLDGGTSFKLTKSRSDETKFTTRSGLTQSATNFAKRYGLELDLSATGASARTANTRRTSRSCGHADMASDSVIV